jgi:hypothetical protein
MWANSTAAQGARVCVRLTATGVRTCAWQPRRVPDFAGLSCRRSVQLTRATLRLAGAC